MKAEDLGAIVADHKALQLLLVHRESASLDVEVASSREAEHIFTLGIPSHTVGIRLLRDRDGEKPVTTTLGFGTIYSYIQSSSLFKA